MKRPPSSAIVAMVVAVLGTVALILNFTALADNLGGSRMPAAVGVFLILVGAVLAVVSYKRRGDA